MEESTNPLYAAPVLEFVQTSLEFCRTLEQCRNMERRRFIDVMRGLLAMIYLKATLLPETEETEGYNAPAVTEADYDFVREGVAAVLGPHDDFLDVFVEDFKYSERPVLCTVSENLADIYQSVRDFVEVYRQGFDDASQLALFDVQASFAQEWGQKATNALRALHDARFHAAAEEEADD